MKIQYTMKNGLTANIDVPKNKTVTDVLSYALKEMSNFTKYKTINGSEKLYDVAYTPKSSMYVELYNSTLNVVSKYSNTYDLRVRLSNKGANNLFDFSGFYLHNTKNNEIVKAENLSDWFGPYIVQALNKANGDNRAQKFTGGSHAYNGDATGAPTAKTKSIEFLIDGKKYESYSGSANNITVKWSNYVQAYNTTKIDGRGREVLKESWTLQYNGIQWLCENEIHFLEDCILLKYYGLQSTCNLWKSNILFQNSTNQNTSRYGIESNSGSKTCNLITVNGAGGHCMDIGLDLSTGLGNLELLQDVNYNAFATSGSFGKVYYYLANGENMVFKDEIYKLQGYYKFYPR